MSGRVRAATGSGPGLGEQPHQDLPASPPPPPSGSPPTPAMPTCVRRALAAPPCQPDQPQPCPALPQCPLPTCQSRDWELGLPPAAGQTLAVFLGEGGLGPSEGHSQLRAASGGPESSVPPGHSSRPALPFEVAWSEEEGGKLESGQARCGRPRWQGSEVG